MDNRALKAIYDKYGDAGDVAFEAKKKQSFTLRKPKPLTIKGVYGREMFDTWYAMSAMLASSSDLERAVRSVITHRFPAQMWQDAFDAARSGQCGKVVIVMDDTSRYEFVTEI